MTGKGAVPTYGFVVDNKSVSVHSDAELPLLYALRSDLGTVELDGEPVRACATPVSAAAGKTVNTARSGPRLRA